MDCSRPPCSSSRPDATHPCENIILRFDDMCSRKEGEPVIYQLSDRRSIDPSPDTVVRSAKAMQFISFMSSLEGCVGI